ncbi:PilL N-terminal domain-containing protein [Achromobacter pestifer]|uniref:Integrating conjugative element protein pill, pfgi-1 n=1 Tax=Achromobacter pestifer TaxID=1353889 RepID=A0A6S6YVZ2_9BURK|nr:PilL N-terminal domain-containing protein [Achromobacter pestifer]CAB3647936.1 hypothetical protein LMG3431_02613 [Achromobacter pestifer]
MRPIIRTHYRWAAGGLLAASTLIAGCVTAPSEPAPAIIEQATEEAPVTQPGLAEPDWIPVVRYGRYTLVELAPGSAQRDLLAQIIDVTMPDTSRADVGEALRYALLRSGYRLCDRADAAALYALPLPAAHLRLGPILLRDALLTLAGPAWDLQVDDTERQVCFARHDQRTPPADGVTPPAPESALGAEAFPIATEARP